jgi:hypothetical protein
MSTGERRAARRRPHMYSLPYVDIFFFTLLVLRNVLYTEAEIPSMFIYLG